jgi:hypothetical protein
MNGRKLFREYAKERHNKEAKEEKCTINYKDMVHWIIRKFPNVL